MTDVEITAAPEPRVVFRKRYTCPFPGCRFQRSTEKPVVEHIARCWSDPAKRTCRTCLNFRRGYVDLVPGQGQMRVDDDCALGEELPENAPVVDCPLWRDRDLGEDE